MIEGVNATTVLVRRMKQGVAEWFRLQIKEKTWKGLVEHALDEWNIGTPAYGYQADRIAHPVPVKASQGRTKTRLALDPVRASVIAQVFTWRVVHKLGIPAITARLNADPARYPAPGGNGWTAQTVWAILGNPKYTGHMVYGRTRTRGGRRDRVPASEWLWSPGPVHPAIIDRATWDAAQQAAGEALHQPRRHRPVPAPGRGPVLPLPRPGPVQDLPAADGRPRFGPARRVHLLQMPARPRQPPPRRRPPRPPAHPAGPRDQAR